MTNTATAPTFEKSPEIQRWMRDGYHAAVRSRNRAYVLCIFMLLVTAAAVFSVSALTPLKEVKTNVVLVDSIHGVVTSVQDGADLQELTAKYAITQSMLYRYVIARESYDAADYKVKYDLVRKMSTRQPREEYEARMAAKTSPISVLGRNGRRTVRIQSVNQLTPETSQVRFTVFDSYDSKQKAEPKHWIAIIGHKYLSTPSNLEDRYENPLGFVVTNYRIDQESALPGVFAQQQPLTRPAQPETAAAATPAPAATSAPAPAPQLVPQAQAAPAPVPQAPPPSPALQQPQAVPQPYPQQAYQQPAPQTMPPQAMPPAREPDIYVPPEPQAAPPLPPEPAM